MMELTSEMLNKYSDGELSEQELSELNELITANPDALGKLKAQKLIDKTATEIETQKPSVNFTEKVMRKILSSNRKENKANGMFVAMLSVLGIGTAAVVIYAFIDALPYTGESILKLDSLTSIMREYLGKVNNFSALLSSPSLIWIGALLSVILLAFSIFQFESYREFKKRLNSM